MLNLKTLCIPVVAVALGASASFGAYSTGFELPTFVPEQNISGKDGWKTSNGSGISVTTSQHSEGKQSVYIPWNGSSSGIYREFTATEAPKSDNAVALDFRPGNNTTYDNTKVAWFYVYVKDKDGNDAGKVSYYLRNPTSAGEGVSIQYNINNTGNQYKTFDADTWTNDHWNTSEFRFDADTQKFDLTINGTPILTGLTIGTNATRISRIDAYSQNTKLYIDHVRVVPEPTALGAAAMAGMLLLRRK